MIRIDELTSQDYRILHILDDCHHISKTAEILYLSQPAISMRIKQMELLLGESLTYKIGKQVYLTELAKILKKNYATIQDMNRKSLDTIQKKKQCVEGEITIGTSDTIGIHVLPQLVRKFRELYPQIKLNLTSKPSRIVTQEILEGKIDLGIALSNSAKDDCFKITPLFYRKDVVICSMQSEFRNREEISLSELAGKSIISLDQLSQSRFFIQDWFKERKLEYRIAMELGSIEMIKKYVENDFGVAIVPEFSVMDECKQKRLHLCEISEKIDFQVIALITYKERYLTYAMSEFKHFLKEEIKRDDRFRFNFINE